MKKLLLILGVVLLGLTSCKKEEIDTITEYKMSRIYGYDGFMMTSPADDTWKINNNIINDTDMDGTQTFEPLITTNMPYFNVKTGDIITIDFQNSQGEQDILFVLTTPTDTVIVSQKLQPINGVINFRYEITENPISLYQDN